MKTRVVVPNASVDTARQGSSLRRTPRRSGNVPRVAFDAGSGSLLSGPASAGVGPEVDATRRTARGAVGAQCRWGGAAPRGEMLTEVPVGEARRDANNNGAVRPLRRAEGSSSRP
ncbi:unnamed protein product [Lampetra fluviatilis]